MAEPRPLSTIKNPRIRRVLKTREPKLVENVKRSLVLKGAKTSEVISNVLRDLHMMKKPHSVHFTKRNELRPFEDHTSIEFFSQRNDVSLFAFGSHSKKRPHNLVMGRLYDHQLLDMFEFGVTTAKTSRDFQGGRESVVRVDTKPMFVFEGEEWEHNPEFVEIKNFFLDYFRGEVLDAVNLAALDRVIVCTSKGDTIFFRHYGILLKKSGSKIPRVELEEVGPSMDLKFRRHKSAAADLKKAALRLPRGTSEMPKKKKNIEKGKFGDRMGRVHTGKQDLSLVLRKMKGLKRRKDDDADAAPADGAVPVEPAAEAAVTKTNTRGKAKRAKPSTDVPDT